MWAEPGQVRPAGRAATLSSSPLKPRGRVGGGPRELPAGARGGQWPLGSHLPGHQAVAKLRRLDKASTRLSGLHNRRCALWFPGPIPGDPASSGGYPVAPRPDAKPSRASSLRACPRPRARGPHPLPPRAAGTPGRVPGGLVWPAHLDDWPPRR